MSDPTIIEWVEAILDGDQDAFEEIVITYQNAVYNLCYRMLSERTEAEDATQETFLRAYMNLRRYDPSRSLKPGFCRLPRIIVSTVCAAAG